MRHNSPPDPHLLKKKWEKAMACYSPLTAYKLINRKTKNGKAQIVFNNKELSKDAYYEIQIPCNQCIGCRIAKSREWALRCVHEMSLYGPANNAYLTLTYNNESLPEGGSLNKGEGSDYQLFMKKFRRRADGETQIKGLDGKMLRPIRYFQCGEYGDQLARPHHHACIFNYGFRDKVFYRRINGFNYYRSRFLESLWEHGHSLIGDLTFASAAYVGRYITKKFLGKGKEEHYRNINPETGEITDLVPEYVTMSRRPGIGYYWAVKYGLQDIYSKDYLTYDGKKFMSPSYYDSIFEKLHPEVLENVKNKRAMNAARKVPDPIYRKRVEQKCKELQVRKLKRSFENEFDNV